MPRRPQSTGHGHPRPRGTVQRKCSCRNPATGRPYGASCPKLTQPDHGSWWARYSAPPGPDGKRRRPALGPYPSEPQARQELNRALQRIDDTSHDIDRRITIAHYLDQWLERKQLELAANTYESYREAVVLYLRPGLGHLRMVELRDAHIQDLYTIMRQINRTEDPHGPPSDTLRRLLAARAPSWAHNAAHGALRSGRPLSAARIRRIHAVLHTALNDAIPQTIDRNPADYVTLPRARRHRPVMWTPAREARWRQTGKKPAKVMVWTAAQTGTFLDATTDHRLYALFHLTAFTGLRRGEVVGLPWSDVDLDTGLVTIRDTLYDPEDYDDPDDPKSEAGERTLVLDHTNLTVLRSWRAQQNTERLAAGPAWTDTDRVFTHPDGTALSGTYIYRQFTRLTRRTGLPPIRFHDLRHTAATLARTAEVDMKAISATLGHAHPSYTLAAYGDIEETTRRNAAEATAAIVPRTRHTG